MVHFEDTAFPEDRYDFRYFSPADRRAYSGILSELPYDPELDRFFREERRRKMRERRSAYSHLSPCENMDGFKSKQPGPEEILITRESCKETLEALEKGLKPRDVRRFEMRFLHGLSVKETTKAERLSRSGMDRATRRIRDNLAGARGRSVRIGKAGPV